MQKTSECVRYFYGCISGERPFNTAMTQAPVFRWRRFIALAGGILLAATAIVAASRAGALAEDPVQGAEKIPAAAPLAADFRP